MLQKICSSQDHSGFLQSPASSHIIPPLCPLYLPVSERKAPTPHKGSYCLLLHPYFFECSTPESCPKSHTSPCRPHHPPGLPQTIATFPLCSTGTCSQLAQPAKRNAGGGGRSKQHGQVVPQEKKIVILGTGNLSYRPLCMSKSELTVTNTDTPVHKQIPEEGWDLRFPSSKYTAKAVILWSLPVPCPTTVSTQWRVKKGTLVLL